MADKKKADPAKAAKRTPVAEWVAAGLGLVMLLGVIGYSVWEGMADDAGPPSLSVAVEPVTKTAQGFTMPVAVRNASAATAGQVLVRGVLEQGGAVIEERTATFAYVPGRGEAKGGLVFSRDPRGYELKLTAEGYEEP
jgi:uncharacterized protein (TIGR02588 family)